MDEDGQEEGKEKSMFEEQDSEDSEILSLMGEVVAKGERAHKVNIVPVSSAPPNASVETKDLLARIDKLEEEKAEMQEEKIDLAKAVNNLNELLKESRSMMKTMQQQIDDAEKQGADILPVEVVEERNKVAQKKKKKKKKSRIREEDIVEEEEDEDDAFQENPEIKKMVDNLVPEEDREDAVEEAKRVMLIHSTKSEDLEKKLTKMSKENDLLKKSLEEMKRRGEDSEGENIDNLQEENKALITQIKNLKKKNSDLENELAIIKDSSPGVEEKLIQDEDNEEDSEREIKVNTNVVRAPVSRGPCKNCPKLKETFNDLEEKIAILEEENLHIKLSLSREEDKAIRLDQELSDLRLNYSELSKQKPGKKGNTDSVLRDQIQTLMNQNKELKEHNKELDKKTQPTKRLEVKLDKKDKEIEKLHMKIEKLQDKIEFLEQNQEVSPHKKTKGKKAGAGSQEARALKAKEKELAKLKNKVDKLEDRVETLTITAETRREEIKNLHSINKEQEREIKSYKGDIASVEKSNNRSLKKGEKLREKELKEAAAKKNELEKKLAMNKGKMAAENDNLKKELGDMKKDLEGRLKVLKDQSIVLNTQLDEAEQGIKERDNEIKKLQKTIDEMKEQVDDAQDLLVEHKAVKKQLKEITNDFGIVEVKYKEETKKRKRLHNIIEDMKGKIRVFARARPMSEKEIKEGNHNACTFQDEMSMTVETKNGPKRYNFDN